MYIIGGIKNNAAAAYTAPVHICAPRKTPRWGFDSAAAMGALTRMAMPAGNEAMPKRVPMTAMEGERAGQAAEGRLEQTC